MRIGLFLDTSELFMLSNENFKLKKVMLLKSISLDLSKGIISEKIVETLQSIKDLNRKICRDYNSEKFM